MYAESPFASERTELFVRVYSVQKFTAVNPGFGKMTRCGKQTNIKNAQVSKSVTYEMNQALDSTIIKPYFQNLKYTYKLLCKWNLASP